MIFTQQLGGLGLIASLVAAGGGGVTWDPAQLGSGAVLSNGNLTVESIAPSLYANARSTVFKSAGKWYFEVELLVIGSGFMPAVGISNRLPSSSDQEMGGVTGGYGLRANGGLYRNGSYSGGWTAGLNPGDIVMVAFDMSAGEMWFGKNGTWLNSGDPATGANPAATGISGDQYAGISAGPSGSEGKATARFSAADFSYSPPAGFSELS